MQEIRSNTIRVKSKGCFQVRTLPADESALRGLEPLPIWEDQLLKLRRMAATLLGVGELGRQ
jgi:hypothetical protein